MRVRGEERGGDRERREGERDVVGVCESVAVWACGSVSVEM